MPPLNIIKLSARNSLKDKWASTLGVGAILLSVLALHFVLFEIFATVSINFLRDYISPIWSLSLLILLTPFFACPLLYGALRWFWFTTDGNDLPISEMFCFFSSGREYAKAISLSFRIFLRIATVLILCFFPSVIVFILSNPETYIYFDFDIPEWASSIWFLSGVLNIFGIIMSAILLMRYFAAPILMINDADISPCEALNLSVIISKNAAGQTLSFLISYTGWFLLSLLVMPLIFTLPLFLAGYSIYCRCLIDYYNENVAIKSRNIFTAPNGNI